MKYMRFNPCFNGTYSLTKQKKNFRKDLKWRFNPCFNGTYSLTEFKSEERYRKLPF